MRAWARAAFSKRSWHSSAKVALSTPSTPTCSWMMWHVLSLPLTMSMTPETPIVLNGAPEDVLMSNRSEGRKIGHNQPL